MSIKCEICGINNARVKDYRNNGISYTKYLVCENCFMLNDRWFFKLKYAKEGIAKREIISQMIEDTWKSYFVIQ